MTEIPEAARRARQMYAEGATIITIKAETGLTHSQLYRWIEGRDGLPPLTKRRIVKKARISAGDRNSVIARIMHSSERQVAEIEKRIGTPGDQGDKDARTLATICRTMRELTAIEIMNRGLEKPAAAGQDDEDRPPDDIDEFREELTRRIHSIIASRRAAGPADNDKP
ncbi:MAG: hypothetical protein JO254_13110 [Pseudolabrys sp.]|nr:hypothetical protein [Pseudolabrys sp.]